MKHPLWEPVIGLEIHIQLNTASKIFSPAPNRFGSEPNINISAVCTGQPGALPVLNREAVKKAALFGLAVGAKVSRCSTFDRKSYFYPDSPRNFQITQYENPIIIGGSITAHAEDMTHTFSIESAHLEDDTGMLKHFSSFAGVDYNRAGSPLIEVVSKPCIHSAKQASAYAKAIRAIALYLDISDGNMEEGSLRIDANISVRLKGEIGLRPRIEIKNLNSFTFLEMAIDAEVDRQIDLYTRNPEIPCLELIPPGTYRWDQESKKTVLMRSKESADDYRYFPEPDLGPVLISQETLDSWQSTLPELPQARLRRYTSDLGLTEYAATTLIQEKKLADYFERALKSSPYPRTLCNWITVEFAGRLKAQNKTLLDLEISPEHMGALVSCVELKKITGPMAKAIADEMMASPQMDPQVIIASNPKYQPMQDTQELELLIDQVLKENPQSVLDYKGGRERVFASLVGAVMKLTQGKAPPLLVRDLLLRKIDSFQK